MTPFIPHHLAIGREHTAGNGDLGRVFLLPGSDGRARRIADRLSDRSEVPSDRQLNVYLGHHEHDGRMVDLGVVATGMGCPSLDIVATELIKLGARSLIRVGTAGSLQRETIRVGDLVIATGSVRDEAASDAYASRDVPAVADPDVVRALERGARTAGLGERTYRGIVHSKDSLFGREFMVGPRARANEDYMRQLTELGVLASEMETAHLFILAAVHGGAPQALAATSPSPPVVRCGAVLAIIGDDGPFATGERVATTERAAIEVALAGAWELVVRGQVAPSVG